MGRQLRESEAEFRKTIAAYLAMSKQTTAAKEVEPRSEPAANVFRTLRLYTGVALLGAISGGVAFSWSGHRELAQVIGAATVALAYFVARLGIVHGKQDR
jgi:anti-sigma factor RsiW